MADKKISEETILTKDGTEIIPVIQSDGLGGWINGALPITDFSDVTIYTGDSALTGNRTVDLNTFQLWFKGGGISTGNSPSAAAGFSFKQVGGTGGDGFEVVTDGDGTAYTANMTGTNTFGLNFKVAHNKIFDSNITPDPSNIASSIFTIWSTRKGVLLLPRMTKAERDAIGSPADGLMVHNTEINYPDIYHPQYGWQSIGYGEIRIMIDFSETPLNAGNSWTLEFNTSIPSNKIIHKLVCVGTSIPDPSIQLLYFGMASQDDYFSASPADISDVSGTVSSGNSMRTSVSNEAFKVRYGPLGAEPLGIDSGQLEILILHT